MGAQINTLRAWDLAVGGDDQNGNPTNHHRTFIAYEIVVMTNDEEEAEINS
jgi:hypothetical protein